MIKKISLLAAIMGIIGVSFAKPISSATFSQGTATTVCDDTDGAGPAVILGGPGVAAGASHTVLAQGFRHVCSANVMLQFNETLATGTSRIEAASASRRGNAYYFFTTNNGASTQGGTCAAGASGNCVLTDVTGSGMTAASQATNS